MGVGPQYSRCDGCVMGACPVSDGGRVQCLMGACSVCDGGRAQCLMRACPMSDRGVPNG